MPLKWCLLFYISFQAYSFEIWLTFGCLQNRSESIFHEKRKVLKMVRKHRAKSFWHKSLRDNSKMCHCHFPDAEQKKTVMTTVFFCEKFTIAKICLLENTQENNEHFNSFEKALKNSLSSFQISLEDFISIDSPIWINFVSIFRYCIHSQHFLPQSPPI